MRKTIAVRLLLATTSLLSLAQAQQGDRTTRTTLLPLRQSDSYQLGARSVIVPAPLGFVEAFSQSEPLAAILRATEDPNNEVLTAHVPVDVLDKLKKGERQEFNFYTKVSVLKFAKARDMTQSEFDSLVAYLVSTSAEFLDINGPAMKSAVKNLSEGVSSVTGNEVPVELDQPLNLGSFDKTKDVYSIMLVMNLKAPSRKLPVLCGMTLMKVNRRLLYVYTYRKFTSEKDAELLRDFTRDWVRQILSANR